MYSFSVTAGQVIDFDIDTAQHDPGGLGTYIRLFNSQGTQLDFNDDGSAPGENVVKFDAYLRYNFTTAGTFYLGVSNYNNMTYDAVTGNGDTAGGLDSTGNYQLTVQALPVDPDDAISESTSLGAITTTPRNTSASITPDIDVDMFSFAVSAGQVIAFDIDTIQNGPGGLGSYLRLFNNAGTQLAFNNDGVAPGETLGFDAYFQYTFTTAGIYYLGVSNNNNVLYNSVNGNGDTAGGFYSVGAYQLIVQSVLSNPIDPDDALSEAQVLGAISTTPVISNDNINPDTDVDMYRFTVTTGQVIDFDIDTVQNGPGGLGSYIRLFNAQGTQLAANDDAAAPGEILGFDAYLRYTFATAGTYYLGVSNLNNVLYNPVNGNSDTAGGFDSIGSYQLIVQSPASTIKSLTVSITPNAIPEINGVAVGTVSRNSTDLSQPLTVMLTSSDLNAATVTALVIIPANRQSANFQVIAVNDTTRGTVAVSITASATDFINSSQIITVTDSQLTWHNSSFPNDVNADGMVSPVDALLIINHLNEFGIGSIPAGSPPPYLDVSGDNQIWPLDALLVINILNQIAATGEGESSLESNMISQKTFLVDTTFAQYWGSIDDHQTTESYSGRKRMRTR